MVTSTTNLLLSKYGPNDSVDINGINANLDKLDLEYGKIRNFRRSVDLTQTLTVTPANIFTIPMKSNTTYLLDGIFFLSFTATSANIVFDYTVSGGAINENAVDLMHTAFALGTGTAIGGPSVPTTPISAGPTVSVNGFRYCAAVRNSGTDGGSLILRIAPAASVSGTLTLKAGSMLRVANLG